MIKRFKALHLVLLVVEVSKDYPLFPDFLWHRLIPTERI